MRKTILLFALSTALFAVNAGAQTSQTVPAVRFGHIDAANATLEQVLAFPRIVVMNPTCTVAGFTISIVPKGKNLIGPFKTEGGTLTDAEVDLIKKNGGENTRIFVEGIRIKCGPQEYNGKDVVVNIIKGK